MEDRISSENSSGTVGTVMEQFFSFNTAMDRTWNWFSFLELFWYWNFLGTGTNFILSRYGFPVPVPG